MKKRFYRRLFLVLAAVFFVISVTACAGGGSKSASAETAAAAAYDAAPAAGISDFYSVAETAASYENTMMDGGYYEEDYKEDYAIEEKGRYNEPMEAAAVSRKLIRTVSLDVETTDFDNLLASVQSTVTASGGYIEQSDVSGTSISASQSRNRYAYLTLRIPSKGLDSFLTQMAQQSNVINRSENVQDVTLQYTDIESRKKSLTIEQERLWALLEKADTLEAVIALEERLSEIRYELEGFESQLRVYDNQVDYSTVHVSIQEVGVFTPTTPDSVGTRIQKGFIRNLENVISNITDFIVWFISHLPALVVLAAIIGILLLFGKLVFGKRAQKQAGSSAVRKPFFKASGKAAKKEQARTPESGKTPEENAALPDLTEHTEKEPGAH